jgi:uncharacterized membrane protein
MKKKNNFISLENVFIIIALVSGLFFVVFIPPNTVPDEGMHIARVYGILAGKLASRYTTLPQGVITLLQYYHSDTQVANIPLDVYLRTTLEKPSSASSDDVVTALYSPVLYIPQLIGTGIGRIFGMADMAVLILGRLFSLVVYVVVCYTILKNTSVAKNSLFVLFSMPMALYLAASYSVDTSQNLLSFIYIFMVVNSLSSTKKLAKRDLGIFWGLSLLLGFSKPVSFVLIFLALAIPATYFDGFRHKLIFVFGQFTLFGLSLIAGSFLGTGEILVYPYDFIQPQKQFLFILFNPISYIKMLFFTLGQTFDFYFYSTVGLFGWLTIRMPEFIYFIFIIAMLMALSADVGQSLYISNGQKVIFVGVIVTYVMAVITALYLFSSPVGNVAAYGVQGRYFIPVLPLLIYLISSLRFNKNFYWERIRIISGRAVVILSSIVLVFVIQVLYYFYYMPCGKNFYTIESFNACDLPFELRGDSLERTAVVLDRTFAQTFTVDCDELSNIAFFLVPYAGDQTGSVSVTLRDIASTKVVFQDKTFVPQVLVGKWKEFSFPPVRNAKKRQFSLIITPLENPITAAALGLTSTDAYPYGKIVDEKLPGDLIFKYTCRNGFLYQAKRILGW